MLIKFFMATGKFRKYNKRYATIQTPTPYASLLSNKFFLCVLVAMIIVNPEFLTSTYDIMD